MKHLQAIPEAVRQPQVQLITLTDAESGQRLDHFLIRVCKGVPKSHLQRVIRSGEVRVNRLRAKPDQRLEVGDIVRVPPIWIEPKGNEPKADELRASERPGYVSSANRLKAKAAEIPILFEDEHLIAVNKPEGVAVHGGSGISSGVIEQLRAAREPGAYLELIHRIDKETSGLLLIAKKRMALVSLQQQFANRAIKKTYKTIVFGKVPKRTKTINSPLLIEQNSEGQKKVRVSPTGLTAITHLTGVAQSRLKATRDVTGNEVADLSFLNVTIETGRTHQIRVHCAAQGWPIVGDERYGNFELNKLLAKSGAKRMFLHAFSVLFFHPLPLESGAPNKIYLEAPLPNTFLDLMPEAAHSLKHD